MLVPSVEIKPKQHPRNNIGFFKSTTNAYDTVFVVVDMQPYFNGAKKPATVSAVAETLTTAMSQGHLILFVNYDRQNQELINGQYVPLPIEQREERDQLHPELQKLTASYPNKTTLWKQTDTGADVILDYFKSKNISFSRICVTGTNVCGCVSWTVKELANATGEFLIELNEDSCGCDCDSDVCARCTISCLEDHKGVVNSSNKNNNLLVNALNHSNPVTIQKILSDYEDKIMEYEKTKECVDLVDIKRDLLIARYFLKSGRYQVPQANLNLQDSMKRLLDMIQASLDKKISERCTLM